MKRYQITLEGRAYEVLLLSDPMQEQVQVEVDGVPFTVGVKVLATQPEPDAEAVEAAEPAVSAETSSATLPARAQAVPPADNYVTAPLPGVIKSVFVRSGRPVSPGDELLVIEAMKMDNIIRASRSGTVETIYVSEGHHVAYGERLLAYAPSGAV